MPRGKEIAVDASASKFYFDGCEQNVDRQTGEIRTTEDGTNRWFVYALEKKEGKQGSTPLKVHVASKNNPCIGFTDYQPLGIKGLKYMKSFDKNGGLIEWYTAESIEKA